MALSNDQVARFFSEAPVRITGNVNLRIPQVGGYEAARAHFGDGGHRAVEQIPVGCGKTGLITLLPFRIARGRVLVIAPNLTIKRQLRDALDVTSQGCFYRKVGALTDLTDGPFVASLDADANLSDCDDAHVVVTNIHQLAARADRWLPEFEDGFFDLIVVVEVITTRHRAGRMCSIGSLRRVSSASATPFRSDDRPSRAR
ncbi:MAG: DEAD/DEAH box helicase family protein [Actinomycetota bacterium]